MAGSDFITGAVAALRKQDRTLKLFGAEGHGHVFNPSLSEAEVKAFEERHQVRLPADYRQFLIEVGNGGAGPHYGVFRLGEMDERWGEPRQWKEGEFVGQLRKPWPHRAVWRIPEEEWVTALRVPDDGPNSALAQYRKRLWDEAMVAGAFPICHQGCALRDWLVVTGPEAGHVWHDARTDGGGLRPYERVDGYRWTFTDWYLDWLNGALREFNIKFTLTQS